MKIKSIFNQKKIAVIGSGFSGLAVCWFLLNLENPPHVILISKGDEASKISAGILHKYMGLYAKLNPFAVEAEKETRQLIKLLSNYSSVPIILNEGIIRVALTEKQKIAYAKCAQCFTDVHWLENCQTYDPNLSAASGIYIDSGLTIDTKSYLDALKKACIANGLIEEVREVVNCEELSSYHHIIGSMGPFTTSLDPFKTVPLHPLKGQLLEIHWPNDLPKLPYTLVSQIYLAMCPNPERAVIGATYEHTFNDSRPDCDFAIQTLLPKAFELYPKLKGCKILEVKAGIRATTPNRLPFAKLINERYSILAGMGSSGLLYHAYFAKQLTQNLIRLLA